MSNTKGKSIRLFMVDGTPQGILTLEVMNWTGHILMGPRAMIAELILRPEMKKTGVYILNGPDPEGTLRPCIYVGESDNVGHRLVRHNKDPNKDFWERACIITSKDQNLTKAHVRYLESRFIAIARETGHAKLFNGTAPVIEGLPEADIADMEYFITQVRLILPVLGMEYMRDKPQVVQFSKPILTPATTVLNDSPLEAEAMTQYSTGKTFEIFIAKENLRALAKEVEGDFIVLAGSETRGLWTNSVNHYHYRRLFETLVAEGRIRMDHEKNMGIFLEDVAFTSPSAAAAVIYGRGANGRTSWTVKGTNTSYADWQNEQLLNTEKLVGMDGEN